MSMISTESPSGPVETVGFCVAKLINFSDLSLQNAELKVFYINFAMKFIKFT